MKRYLLVSCLLLILTSCQTAGTEGGKCLEGGNICLETNLICNVKNVCERCGEKGTSCCADTSCQEGLDCTEGGYCYECGGVSQACCEGSVCQGNLTCGVDNTCQSCGSVGSPCCENRMCEDISVCDSQDICQPCGLKGESCCEGGEYQCIVGACVADGTCQTELCDAGGNCSECGIIAQPCCEGGTCQKGYICGAGSQCESCGFQGDPVCTDGSCNGYWQNVNGICENPFEIDPAADIALCEKVDAGYSADYEREWCYWHAAFNKQETSICEMIDWDKMRNKCLELADPDYYSIIDW